MSSEFGARLRQFRIAAGLTQEVLAERSGLSVNAVSALERGERRHPYPSTIQALAEALGLSDSGRAELSSAAVAPQSTGEPGPADRLVGFPVLTTPTFGRERDIAAAVGLLHDPRVRLLTLTGPGGVGKTRLVQLVAVEASPMYGDGAHFVPLAAISDHRHVEPAIVQSLAPHREGSASISDVVRGREVLLVLDNFEQVPGAAPFIAEALRRCPALTVLVTSRRPLHIDGEQEYPVSPLTTPPAGDRLSLEELAEIPAVSMFLQRARAVRPDFTLTAGNAPEVAALCARLEGLPLALELAASRAKLLSPQAILANLTSRLALLTGGGSDRPARLQTMRGAIGWSFEHLPPDEQAVFRRMAVFAGGGSLEAIAAVTSLQEAGADSAAITLTTLDAVMTLIDHSLMFRVEDPGGEVRVGMLEVIREFAREQLVASGESAAAHDAHARWFLDYATAARIDFEGAGRRAAHDRIQRDLDNLRSALSWACQCGDAVLAHRLVVEMARFWINFGYLDEGWSWFERVLAIPDPGDPELRFDLLYWASIIRLLQNQQEAAGALACEALLLARRTNHRLNIGRALSQIGDADAERDPEGARARIEESLVIFRELGEPFREAIALRMLGLNASRRGEHGQAIAYHTEALAIWKEMNHPWGVPISYRALAEVALAQGDLVTARGRFQESLMHWRQSGERLHMSECFTGLARVAVSSGMMDLAVILLGAQARLDRAMGYGHGDGEHRLVLADARALVPADRFADLWAQGQAMTLDQALDEIMAIPLPWPVQPEGASGRASRERRPRPRSA
jgi:predicted ATPase/DNA-binding XRE family transcriptional regulator